MSAVGLTCGQSAAALVAAFGSPGVLERVITVPFGAVPGVVALHLRMPGHRPSAGSPTGWQWATVEGLAQPAGPDDPQPALLTPHRACSN